ncbi:N-acetyl-gamma-glutamyl-phosphate reductase [soil metagenome]
MVDYSEEPDSLSVMNHTAIRAMVLGATGYTGRELMKLLAAHPSAEIRGASSQTAAGGSTRHLIRGGPDLTLVRVEDADFTSCDVVFSCLPHGESEIWVKRARAAGARVIDLSSDLRVPDANAPPADEPAVYGLPELHRERIAGASLVANPGCYPTAALLALAPVLRRGLATGPIVINAASGVTGAGRSPKRELLFGEVAEDFRAYAVGNVHRHLAELRDQASKLSGPNLPDLVFTPHLLPVKRGILETIHVQLREPIAGDLLSIWTEDFGGEPFVDLVSGGSPALSHVVGSNRVAIAVTAVEGMSSPMVIVTAVIDNLLKGAAGQAVQNMNLMMGLSETEGLPC